MPPKLEKLAAADRLVKKAKIQPGAPASEIIGGASPKLPPSPTAASSPSAPAGIPQAKVLPSPPPPPAPETTIPKPPLEVSLPKVTPKPEPPPSVAPAVQQPLVAAKPTTTVAEVQARPVVETRREPVKPPPIEGAPKLVEEVPPPPVTTTPGPVPQLAFPTPEGVPTKVPLRPEAPGVIPLERESKYDILASVQRLEDARVKAMATAPAALIKGVVESLEVASDIQSRLRLHGAQAFGLERPVYYAEPVPPAYYPSSYGAYRISDGTYAGTVSPPAPPLPDTHRPPASPPPGRSRPPFVPPPADGNLPYSPSSLFMDPSHYYSQYYAPAHPYLLAAPWAPPPGGEYSQYRLPEGLLVEETRPPGRFDRIPRDSASRFRRYLGRGRMPAPGGPTPVRYGRPAEFEPPFDEPGSYGPDRNIGRTPWKSVEHSLNLARSADVFTARAEPASPRVAPSPPPTPRSYEFGPEYDPRPWRKEFPSDTAWRREAREAERRGRGAPRRGGPSLRGRRRDFQGGLTTYRRSPYRSLSELATYYTQLDVEDQSDVISLLLACRKLEKQIEEQHVILDMLDHDLRQAQETLRFPPEWQEFKDLDLSGVPPADIAKIPEGQLPLYVKGRVLLQQREPPPGATYILEPDMARAIPVTQPPAAPPGKPLDLEVPKPAGAGPKPLGPKPLGPKPLGPKPVGAKPVGAKPLGPKPLVKSPVPPKPPPTAAKSPTAPAEVKPEEPKVAPKPEPPRAKPGEAPAKPAITVKAQEKGPAKDEGAALKAPAVPKSLGAGGKPSAGPPGSPKAATAGASPTKAAPVAKPKVPPPPAKVGRPLGKPAPPPPKK